jgi:quinol-cytochrome oxidoreductase complex cytochrome b subunit
MHMLLIPGLIFALIGLHLYLVIRLGVSSPPWSRDAAGGDWEEVEPVGNGRVGLTQPAARSGWRRNGEES